MDRSGDAVLGQHFTRLVVLRQLLVQLGNAVLGERLLWVSDVKQSSSVQQLAGAWIDTELCRISTHKSLPRLGGLRKDQSKVLVLIVATNSLVMFLVLVLEMKSMIMCCLSNFCVEVIVTFPAENDGTSVITCVQSTVFFVSYGLKIIKLFLNTLFV